jgi:hypothetical protein
LKTRSGEKPASGGCKTITRIAEIAAWLTNRFLSEKNTAAAIARATTTPICTVPTPMTNTTRSAINNPMATPKTTSTVRLPRCPIVKPREMTAAIGAKKGCSLPSTTVARKYATLAATDVWITGQTLVPRRPAPAVKRCRIL